MDISNIIDFFIGAIWTFLGPAFVVLAWRLSGNAFPINHPPSFYGRVVFLSLSAILYVFVLGLLMTVLSENHSSEYSRQFIGAGALAGLISYVFTIK